MILRCLPHMAREGGALVTGPSVVRFLPAVSSTTPLNLREGVPTLAAVYDRAARL